eukprot:gene35581-43149_t
MVYVDYDGVIAAGKDIAQVLLCEVLHIFCNRTVKQMRSETNTRPEMVMYSVFNIVQQFIAMFGCVVCTQEPTNEFVKRFVKRYSNLSVKLPVVDYSMQSMRSLSEEESQYYESNYSPIMYRDHSATMMARDAFHVIEMDEASVYDEDATMAWMRKEVVTLFDAGKLCGCPGGFKDIVKTFKDSASSDVAPTDSLDTPS